MPLERRDPGPKPVAPDHQILAAPVADEGGRPLEAGRHRGDIVLDDQAGRGIVAMLGMDGDQGAVIFLAGALDEDDAGDPADRAFGQVDHIIRALALAIVETVVQRLDMGRTALQIMAAGAALEARVGDPNLAVMADIDAMGAIAVRALAEAAERGEIDRDRTVRIGGGKDAALAVDEHRLDDVEIALL